MSLHPNLAQWRLDNGSRCDICPYRGQRVVGTDGPLNAEFICVAEAPGQQEEEWGIRYGDKFGRPLVGPTGALWKYEELHGAGGDLVRLLPREGKSDLPLLHNVFVTNVVMCRPKHNKIDTPDGRKAAACCAPSLRRLILRLLAENPNRTLMWMGNLALAFSRGKLGGSPRKKGQKKPSVGPWRGRPLEPTERALSRLNKALEEVPSSDLERFVLRGQKPKEVWWPEFAAWLKSYVKLYRKAERAVAKRAAKEEEAAILAANPWLTDWTKVWKKQLAALKRKEKKHGSKT